LDAIFFIGQGFLVTDNVVYQDNQSVMLLENNGKMSSSKRTCHLNLHYFFVTDNIQKKNLQVEYCPTDDMIGEFLPSLCRGLDSCRSVISSWAVILVTCLVKSRSVLWQMKRMRC
jgi:hypothetical protein